MKRIIPVIILFCLISPLLNGQSLTNQFITRMTYGRNNLTSAEIQGSPYLNKEYQVGTVQTDGDIIYSDIPLRYNCFEDVLEFTKNKVSYDLIPKTIVKRAEFGGQVFSCKDYESKGGTEKSYFEILVEGKASLLVHYSIKFFEKEPLKGYAEPKPARFDDFEKNYYISINNSPAKKISNNKKWIEILADKQKDVDSYISKQKLSVKKAEDMKKIIGYYNSLL